VGAITGGAAVGMAAGVPVGIGGSFSYEVHLMPFTVGRESPAFKKLYGAVPSRFRPANRAHAAPRVHMRPRACTCGPARAHAAPPSRDAQGCTRP